MTIHESIVFGAVNWAGWLLAHNNVDSNDIEACHRFFWQHPIGCAGWIGAVHAHYHMARMEMRRIQDRVQRNWNWRKRSRDKKINLGLASWHRRRKSMRGLSRPQRRRWHQMIIQFQWLWDVNALVSQKTLHCWDCDHRADCPFLKFDPEFQEMIREGRW